MNTTIKIPETLFHQATFDRASLNEDDRTVEMTISSDAPYERYFGMEILDHREGSIDMSRISNGAPLLFNHNRDMHIGRIMEARTDGQKLRIKAKFGNSALANEKYQDVKDGILTDTSVGYRVNEMVLERECENAPNEYRVTSWTPYEGSLVTIPADATVGVGRNPDNGGEKEIAIKLQKAVDKTLKTDKAAHESEKNMTETQTTEGVKIDVNAEKQAALANERLRIKRINEFAAGVKVDGMKSKVADLARQAAENGTDFDSFRASVLDQWETDGVKAVRTESNPQIGMSKKELSNYSLAKAILERAIGGTVTGLEKEASDEMAKKLGKSPNGFYIPEDWAARGLQEMHGLSNAQAAELQRTLVAGNFVSAGALIGTNLLAASMIDLLRNKALLASLGPTVLSGLVGNVAIPKQTGGGVAYWLPEGGSVTPSTQTFAQLGLTPKRLVAQTAYDKQLLAQASLSVEAIVREDLSKVMGLKKDLAGIAGLGSAGEPLGILNTTGKGTVTFGGAPTWAKLVEFETTLATANADQLGTPVWLTTPGVRGKWKTTAKIGSTFPVFLSEGGEANGYKLNVTNQVPSNKVLYFVPSELIFAEWAGIDVVNNPYSLDSTGQIRLTVTQMCDIAVRHPEAFVVSTDAGNQ